MEDTPAAACATASATVKSQRRINWPDATTRALLRLWEDNLAALRSNVRNARIYSRIVEELNAGLPHGEGPYNLKQIRLKMDNLAKRYRKERLLCTRTGSSSSKWPYYWLLHNFLGSLPMNDELLVEENVEVPEVTDVPEGAEVVASWDDAQNDENVVPRDNAEATNETPEETSSPSTHTVINEEETGSAINAPSQSIGPTRTVQSETVCVWCTHNASPSISVPEPPMTNDVASFPPNGKTPAVGRRVFPQEPERTPLDHDGHSLADVRVSRRCRPERYTEEEDETPTGAPNIDVRKGSSDTRTSC
ncbi:hypothetical protein HPB50_010259 [Hyalomma asiaticum]|uniref:Uncharacterized protein n=1 Tax=Hyalomma asiaticum TaxID=266040 RepID=A0ACB7SPG9_HYAAI|nr:hypothetical protein HPB50_010259 [Hyalomma asiaticum]